ncbi:uncharacterized protein [Amphiura filiformis]|uniref:uncharacterized protein n=1 Tax=Amphiura filiformis TaxID=82378 RepID=UPI003B21E23D
MGILENCCFCVSLRAGTVICAIFSLVTSGLGLGWGIYQLYQAALHEDLLISPSYIHIGYCVAVSLWMFHVFTCIVLLASVCRSIRVLMIPYVIAIIVLIIAQFALGSLHLYIQILEGTDSVELIPFIVVTTLLAVSILDIYCLLVVISRWQDIRDDEVAYDRERAFSTHELVPSSPSHRNY